MWREDAVEIYPERIKDSELQKAHENGMVAKYTMGVGWERCFSIFNIYGESGGACENITTTETLLEGCRRGKLGSL